MFELISYILDYLKTTGMNCFENKRNDCARNKYVYECGIIILLLIMVKVFFISA